MPSIQDKGRAILDDTPFVTIWIIPNTTCIIFFTSLKRKTQTFAIPM